MSKRSYKVWIEIEEFVDGNPMHNRSPVLPDSLGFFEGRHALMDAMAKVAEVVSVHGIDPEHSDSVKAVQARSKTCKRCGSRLTKVRGRCIDKTCPYSDREQDKTFTEG
jgi:hypothetical protein